jgi:hypothetical protein
MPTVYVVQEQPNHDISPARQFGEIKCILPPGDANFSSFHIYDQLQEALAGFKIAEDFLLLSGDPTAIAMAAVVIDRLLAPTDEQQINLLKWDRRLKEYFVTAIPGFGE